MENKAGPTNVVEVADDDGQGVAVAGVAGADEEDVLVVDDEEEEDSDDAYYSNRVFEKKECNIVVEVNFYMYV